MAKTKTDIGDKIRTARKRAGLTQQQAATELKTTRVGYARFENDYSNPQYKTLQEIAKAFGCTYDGDFKFKDNNP